MRIWSKSLLDGLIGGAGMITTVLTVNASIKDHPGELLNIVFKKNGITVKTGTGVTSLTYDAKYGDVIEYTVSDPDSAYDSVTRKIFMSGSFTGINAINVELSEQVWSVLKVTTVPADASVVFSSDSTDGYVDVQNSNWYHAPVGTKVNYYVHNSGANIQSETFEKTLDDTEETATVTLKSRIKVVVKKPSDGITVINQNNCYVTFLDVSNNALSNIIYEPDSEGNPGWYVDVLSGTYVGYSVTFTGTNPEYQDISPADEKHHAVNSTTFIETAERKVFLVPVYIKIDNLETTADTLRVVTGTGSVLVNAQNQGSLVGEDALQVSWGTTIIVSATKQNYNSFENSYLVKSSTTVSVAFSLTSTLATITCSDPTAATVTIYAQDQQTVLASGTGTVRALNLTIGQTIYYQASYFGITSTMKSHTMTVGDIATGGFSDTIDISASEGGVEVISDTETRQLLPGKYYYICVGGGASGGTGTTAYYGSSRYPHGYGGVGGPGGASGYITCGSFTITESESFTFTIGDGGNTSRASGEQSKIEGDITGVITTADGGTCAGNTETTYVVGSVRYMRVPTINGTNGGSAGGPGGMRGVNATQRQAATQRKEPISGKPGALGGGNTQEYDAIGYDITTFQIAGSAHIYGGQGFYNETKTFETNGGAVGTATETYGKPGTKGRGLSSIWTSFNTINKLVNLVDSQNALQVLYNAISGGGGGGASFVPDPWAGGGATPPTLTGNWYGGPGAGGGGWENGYDGINDDEIYNEPGDGGNGAIILARVSWE